MNDANALASLKVPRLLSVAPFQNWIWLFLAAVLPLQVVVPSSFFGLMPDIVTSLAKVVVPTPEIVPPVQVTGAWKVWSSPLRTLPLKRNFAVWVPPLIVTIASLPTLSVLIANVPAPCVVAP